MLSKRKKKDTDQTRKTSNQETGDQSSTSKIEILTLNKKIERCAPKGFTYKIDEDTYVHESKSKVKEEEFSSNEELKQKNDKE